MEPKGNFSCDGFTVRNKNDIVTNHQTNFHRRSNRRCSFTSVLNNTSCIMIEQFLEDNYNCCYAPSCDQQKR
ncbi:hypothetical protein OUZ56_031487 [Daphnia magna]|uniref:Uncharacterized protein n=1 Tax=Daphnia magna TaxID=35525 RepID=A0ABQ9ZUD7_9CRUS|nr:hypothetical protein OUZ56_031487 [Daphnia magna]